MARKPAADKDKPDAGKKAKSRRNFGASGSWRPPPLPWILRAGRSTNEIASPTRIFCTGLTEAFLLAANLRDADIVAINPDAGTVKAARTAAARRRLKRLRIEEAQTDQPALGELVGGNFDLVVAYDILHLANDADAALANLASACAEDGTVYASVRSAAHPSARIDAALSVLGITRSDVGKGDDETTATARMLAALGAFLPSNPQDLPQEFGHAATGPAPLAAWLDRAGAAGLSLRATTLTSHALPAALSGGGTKFLAGLSLPQMAVLLDRFLGPASIDMLFSRRAAPAVPWCTPDRLLSWKPVSRFLPLEKLPEMQSPWNNLAGIEVEIHGVLSPQSFTLSRYMVEIVRRSDGKKNLAELMAEVPHETDIAELMPALHFLHHAFILELQAP